MHIEKKQRLALCLCCMRSHQMFENNVGHGFREVTRSPAETKHVARLGPNT